jgi:peptidoglycan/LPS O-acetylase OafA/YrhL
VGRGLSIYLDLLRLLAAVEVVLFHFGHVGIRPQAHQWGHEAVVVFFVLSGFVIRHAAATKDHTLQQYCVSRLSRLYAAIIPCLMFTVLFDYAGMALAPDTYKAVNFPDSLLVLFVRLYSSVFMLNQSWAAKDFLSNAAYWSLCFEFWFYALFACYFYTCGRLRAVGMLLLCAAAGPRILLLAPVWVMGAIAYTERATPRWGRLPVWFGLLQPIVVVLVYVQFDLQQAGRALLGQSLEVLLGNAASVLTDMLLAASFAVHLAAAKRLERPLALCPVWAERVIRFGASRSFTLYLLHLPALYLLKALAGDLPAGIAYWVVALGAFAVPLALAPMIEGQRHTIKPWFERLAARWLPQAGRPVALG